MRATFSAAFAALLITVFLLTPRWTSASTSTNWLQFGFDAAHSGKNPFETTITASNVSQLQVAFHVALPDVADGAPAYLSGVHTRSGVHDLLYVTTKDGHIVALDAHSGSTVWSRAHGPGTCTINRGGSPCYTTSSPVVGPGLQAVYTYGLDGKVHKHAVGNGYEYVGKGWPEVATVKPWNEKGSSALSFAQARSGNAYLYVTNGGYPGDNGDYQGHVTAINIGTGSQRVFNANCSGQPNVHFVQSPASPDCPGVQTAIWARPGAVYDAALDRIFLASGNGPFDPSRHDWGDSVVALHPDGSEANYKPLDSFTPADFQSLDDSDADLGSTAPAILPVNANTASMKLAVQGGKDAKLRLINLANLSGRSPAGPGFVGGEIGSVIGVPQGGEVLTMPAVWTNPTNNSDWVFVANGNGIAGLTVSTVSGTPQLQKQWKLSTGGTSPVIANNVLYFVGDNGIEALDPTSGTVLWSDSTPSGIHWESPIVVNGMVYVTDESGQLIGYKLP